MSSDWTISRSVVREASLELKSRISWSFDDIQSFRSWISWDLDASSDFWEDFNSEICLFKASISYSNLPITASFSYLTIYNSYPISYFYALSVSTSLTLLWFSISTFINFSYAIFNSPFISLHSFSFLSAVCLISQCYSLWLSSNFSHFSLSASFSLTIFS